MVGYGWLFGEKMAPVLEHRWALNIHSLKIVEGLNVVKPKELSIRAFLTKFVTLKHRSGNTDAYRIDW